MCHFDKSSCHTASNRSQRGSLCTSLQTEDRQNLRGIRHVFPVLEVSIMIFLMVYTEYTALELLNIIVLNPST
jgi:hypothetical protein